MLFKCNNKMFEFIDKFYFITSFGIGILLVYAIQPPKQIVNKFPSPDNYKQIVYTDASESCYRFEADEVECNQSSLPQPIVEPMVDQNVSKTDRMST